MLVITNKDKTAEYLHNLTNNEPERNFQEPILPQQQSLYFHR